MWCRVHLLLSWSHGGICRNYVNSWFITLLACNGSSFCYIAHSNKQKNYIFSLQTEQCSELERASSHVVPRSFGVCLMGHLGLQKFTSAFDALSSRRCLRFTISPFCSSNQQKNYKYSMQTEQCSELARAANHAIWCSHDGPFRSAEIDVSFLIPCQLDILSPFCLCNQQKNYIYSVQNVKCPERAANRAISLSSGVPMIIQVGWRSVFILDSLSSRDVLQCSLCV